MKNCKLSILLICFFQLSLSAQQLLERELIHDENPRVYSIYVPSSYNGVDPLPLIFNFHGGSGDIASQIAISDMRTMADDFGFFVVYPQAWPDPNDGGSTNWTHKEPSTIDDVFFVDEMIDEISSEFLIDVNRVYACGYSNGGEFSLELACRLSDRIAAVATVARSMFIETFNACSPKRPMPIVSIHGTKDEYDGISFAGITYYVSLDDLNAFWTNFNNTDSNPIIESISDLDGSDGSTVEHHVWANGDACVSVEHFKVIEGGHDWPGTFGNNDIDASAEIWNFVSQYDLNGKIGCATSNNNIQEQKIKLYPNPSQGNLSVELNDINKGTFKIYTLEGRLVLSKNIDKLGVNNLDVSELDSGMYFLKIGERNLVKFFID